MTNTDEPDIVLNEQAQRFEAAGEPDIAYLTYERSGDRMTLVHTEVADDLEGRGLGSALVRTALDHADAADLTIVPQCPFVSSWLERHPDRAAELDIAAA